MANIIRKSILILLLAAFPSMVSAEVVNRIAAVVNDEIITTYDVAQEAAIMAKEAEKKPRPEGDKPQYQTLALNQLIDKKLAEQKIRELGITVSDEELRQSLEDIKKQNNLTEEALVAALKSQGLTLDKYKALFREQIERLRLMGQEVRSKIQVGEKEISDYYEANKKLYSDEMFQARHIFFMINEKTPEIDIRRIMALSMSVLLEARSGKDFAELARKYSEDKLTAKDGGELGTFKKGETLPDIQSAVESMQAGDISDLVITSSGFHIIKLDKRYTTNAKPLSAVKGEIEEMLYRKKTEERFNQWLADMRKGAAIEIR